jgi:hypothetical protein
MRGRRERLVVAAALLAVGLVALPAAAQTPDPSTTTTEPTTTSEPTVTLLPTTSTTPLPTTTTTLRPTTTTVRRTTTTTALASSAITLPRTTTTTELKDPAGAAQLPTTTSLPPQTKKVDRGRSIGTLVLLVITALLLIALVLAVFTYRFWRSTRPAVTGSGSGTVPRHG